MTTPRFAVFRWDRSTERWTLAAVLYNREHAEAEYRRLLQQGDTKADLRLFELEEVDFHVGLQT